MFVIIFYRCGIRGVRKPFKSTLVFWGTCYLFLIYNGLYKQKLSQGVAPGAQACFLTVKSTATPPRMHCGTHWRAFWPEKARL